MADTPWHIEGDYLLACNCDWGCPCNFNAPPTPGYCQATLGVVVRTGRYGDVVLDGCKAFLTAKWPGAIHEGDGIAAYYVDAPDDERGEALAQIVTGAAGGQPFAIFAATFARVLGPFRGPIHVSVSGAHSKAEAPGRFGFRFRPIANPVTGAEAFPVVVLPQGFIFDEGHQFALEDYWVREGEDLVFAHPGKCAEYAKVSWSNA